MTPTRTWTDYFVDEREPATLYRRHDNGRGVEDRVWAERWGQWVPTLVIIDFMFGHAFDVEGITEAEAIAHWPAAFATA